MSAAPRDAASNGFGGVSMEIHGGPKDGAAATRVKLHAAMAAARAIEEVMDGMRGLRECELIEHRSARASAHPVGCEMPGVSVTFSANVPSPTAMHPPRTGRPRSRRAPMERLAA